MEKQRTDRIRGAASKISKAAEIDGPLRIEYMPIAKLLRAPRNPKTHDIGLIRQSFSRFGYVESIVVDEGTGRLVAGHGRLETLQRKKAAGEPAPERVVEKQGEWFVPVLRGVKFASDADAEAYLLASNQTTIAGGWNDGELAEVLATLAKSNDGLQGTGFDQEDVDALLQRISGGNACVVQDDEQGTVERADELRAKWQTERNQIWAIGPHFLYSGDSREVPAEFFQGNKIRLVLTDSPYGIDYVARKQAALKKLHKGLSVGRSIANDSMKPEATEGLFASALAATRPHCEAGAVIYATVPAGPLLARFIRALESAGFSLKHTLVWIKNHFVIGRCDYHYRHEPILYGWLENGPHYWCGDRSQDSVFEVDKPLVSEFHPTTKPVELVAQMIRNSSRAGEIVYDPFAGSCTMLVAAQQLGRVGYAVELDPAYAAVGFERLANPGLEPQRLNWRRE
jgi:DNA modification methylase